jgi:hypothetical protein
MTLAMQELETGPLHRFQDWPNQQVPKRAAGVYTVWDGERLLYVGMSGRAMTAEDLEVSDGGRVVAKGLWTRLNAHASGRRSGDQFCVYVNDRFVVPELSHRSSGSSPPAPCPSTASSEHSSASDWPTGLLSRRMEPRRPSWRELFGEAVSRWVRRTSIRWIVEARPLPCERKHGRRLTSGDASIVLLTLASSVVVCRLVLLGCTTFAACSPPAGTACGIRADVERCRC